jgi:regulator of protease activity HflC (stomatin/prohibitin superfamily)
MEFIISPLLLFLVIITVGIIITILSSVFLVQQAEAVVIERLGRYHRTLDAGLHIIIPFLDTTRKVLWTFVRPLEDGRYQRFIVSTNRIDMREAVYDFPKQNVITRDNVTTEINALLYYQIIDPKAAIYEVSDLPQAIEKITQTTLRNVIGSMDLDETLVSRDTINHRLRIILDEATDKWGVKINRVELQEVNPPIDIRHAMEKQMRAERERRETILLAEGEKRSAILRAEGQQESNVLRAKGEAEALLIAANSEAQSRLLKTEAEAQAITMIQKAVPQGDPLPYLIAMQYIKALPELTKHSNDKLVVVPYEASSFVGALTSVKKIFDTTQ